MPASWAHSLCVEKRWDPALGMKKRLRPRLRLWAHSKADTHSAIARTSLKQSLRAMAIMFTSLLCSTAGSPHAQTEHQLQLGRRRWGLHVWTRPCLCLWKANSVLLYSYIHRCLEVQGFVLNSFRPLSKLLFHTAPPGIPTGTHQLAKLSPH